VKKLPSLRLLILMLCLGLSFAAEAGAQTCTTTNTPPVNKAGWIKGSTVQVYIDPAITGDRRSAVVDAFSNWSAAASANNSGVTYTIVNSPPAAGTNSFTVNNTQPTEPVRAETVTSFDQYGHSIGAQTSLDPRVTDPAAIREVMAHEIGHPAGFGECTSCAPGDSVMAPGPPQGQFNTVVGRPTSPSACDNQKLQQTDYPYCTPPVNTSDCLAWDANTCTCNQYASGGGGGYGGESGGGGDYYDYCTPYYWYYYESYDGGKSWYLMDVSYAGCW